jgi:hypothetical protein
MGTITAKLVELGLAPNAGWAVPGPMGDVDMKPAEDPHLKRLREAATNLLGADRGN